MNDEVNLSYLPYPHLIKHTDRVVKCDKKWLVLDGINIDGNPLRTGGLLSVYYHNFGYNVIFQVTKEMYKIDYNHVWEYIRHRVAYKLCQLRKETDKE